jgi:hypothetical protein
VCDALPGAGAEAGSAAGAEAGSATGAWAGSAAGSAAGLACVTTTSARGHAEHGSDSRREDRTNRRRGRSRRAVVADVAWESAATSAMRGPGRAGRVSLWGVDSPELTRVVEFTVPALSAGASPSGVSRVSSARGEATPEAVGSSSMRTVRSVERVAWLGVPAYGARAAASSAVVWKRWSASFAGSA